VIEGSLKLHHSTSTLLRKTSQPNIMSASELLARWRVLGARQSDEVLELAPKVLKAGRLGDQGVSEAILCGLSTEEVLC
jgi:hypothetical protein